MSNVGLRNIRKSYAGVQALSGVSLAVEEGEFLTLLGASGSGKTTLLNVIAGMVEPDEGTVVIGTRDVTQVSSRERGLGMVFQSYALIPHMSVFDNVAFPLRIRRVRKHEIGSRVARALEMVRLGGFANRRPRELSGGQQQRVAIARCLVYEPRVVLMDEPLGALDKKLREQLQREIRRIHQDLGVTIIYVTHDQEEALYLSDRICLMRNGAIEQVGAPRELYFAPRNAFVADFIGESNLMSCTLSGPASIRLKGAHEDHRVGVTDIESGREAHLMIRPDKIAILAAGEIGANEITGTVEHFAFVGETVRYIVRTGEHALIVKVPADRMQVPRPAGAGVRLGWDPEDCLLLPS